MKRKKPETWWCIATGDVLLPFTARSTRRQCLADWFFERIPARQNPRLRKHEHLHAIVVTVRPKPRKPR